MSGTAALQPGAVEAQHRRRAAGTRHQHAGRTHLGLGTDAIGQGIAGARQAPAPVRCHVLRQPVAGNQAQLEVTARQPFQRLLRCAGPGFEPPALQPVPEGRVVQGALRVVARGPHAVPEHVPALQDAHRGVEEGGSFLGPDHGVVAVAHGVVHEVELVDEERAPRLVVRLHQQGVQQREAARCRQLLALVQRPPERRPVDRQRVPWRHLHHAVVADPPGHYRLPVGAGFDKRLGVNARLERQYREQRHGGLEQLLDHEPVPVAIEQPGVTRGVRQRRRVRRAGRQRGQVFGPGAGSGLVHAAQPQVLPAHEGHHDALAPLDLLRHAPQEPEKRLARLPVVEQALLAFEAAARLRMEAPAIAEPQHHLEPGLVGAVEQEAQALERAFVVGAARRVHRLEVAPGHQQHHRVEAVVHQLPEIRGHVLAPKAREEIHGPLPAEPVGGNAAAHGVGGHGCGAVLRCGRTAACGKDDEAEGECERFCHCPARPIISADSRITSISSVISSWRCRLQASRSFSVSASRRCSARSMCAWRWRFSAISEL